MFTPIYKTLTSVDPYLGESTLYICNSILIKLCSITVLIHVNNRFFLTCMLLTATKQLTVVDEISSGCD